ncbi:hypothetical protein [Rhodoferax ferrireducens]|uniref:hypothetical protein n=1 Tax=Rhodoferax ferrireducens TaxID=192843 RepID=UPI003BB666C4
MGAGYLGGKDKKLEQDRQAAQEKRQQGAFEMQKVTFDQNQANNATLRAAGAPVEVTPEQGPPTEAQYASTPAGQEPDSIGYRVGNGFGAKDFATRGLAETAATQQNTSQGTQARQIAAMQGIGDFAGAQKLRSETAKATSEEQTLAESITARSIQALPSFEHVGKYISDSPANNQNGSFKGKYVVSPDGAVQTFNVVNPDGTLTPTQRTFPNTPQGLELAKNALVGAMTPEQKRIQAQHDITNKLAADKETSEAALRAASANKENAWAAALAPGGTKDKSNVPKKSDHFDDKQWDAAAKIDKSVVSLPNSELGKDIESGDLRSAYLKTFNAARAGGDMAPNEAVEYATSTIVKLKNAAQARVDQARAADKNSTLTVDQAVKGIIREAASFKSSQPAPAASSTRVTPQQQQANDSDRPVILAAELKSAQDRMAAGDPRASDDINALNNEIARLPRGSGRPVAPTPRAIAATRGSAPVASAPTLAPSAPALATRGVQAPAPSYEQWLQAKNARDQLISNANQMSPESRDLYLRSRLPQIEQAIQFNQNYKTY